jgi:CO/xanthine dehydrogenase FAD-binding subunit
MRPFELHIATSLPDALEYLSRHGDETAVLAGGTDLIIRIRSGREVPPRVLDISRLGELRVIGRETVGGPAGGPVGGSAGAGEAGLGAAVTASGVLRLGALVTHAAAVESPETRAHAPLLAEACATIGSPQIRNLATLGGNCVTASRAGDSLPALLALNAEMVLLSLEGERRVKMTEFLTGPRTTARRRDELLGYILVPVGAPAERSCYLKLTQRKALAISLVSVAFRLRMDPGTPRRCLRAAVAFGSLAPTVIRARAVEATIAGRELNEATIARAAEVALGEVSPRDDVRASAEYRRAMVKALVRRGLERLAGSERLAEPAASGALGGRGLGRVEP